MNDGVERSGRSAGRFIRRIRLGTVTMQRNEHVIEELFLLLPRIRCRWFRHDDVDHPLYAKAHMVLFALPASSNSTNLQVKSFRLRCAIPGCFGYTAETNTLRSE